MRDTMSDGNGARRAVAKCADCGSVYPVWMFPGGAVQIIGINCCPCGSSDFEVLG